MPATTTLPRSRRFFHRRMPQRALPTLSILIVDESESNRRALANLLQETHGEDSLVRECDSGLAALELLRRVRTDVVLVDYRLPDMDGLELVSALADMADDMAVVLVSDRASGRVAADALKHGARDYLDREGLDAATLKTAITEALRSARLEWRNSRSIRQLRHEHEQMGAGVRDVSRRIAEQIEDLGESINQLRRIDGEVPLSQLVGHFSSAQGALRQSLAVLSKMAEGSGGCATA